jgi:hypothetical protein
VLSLYFNYFVSKSYLFNGLHPFSARDLTDSALILIFKVICRHPAIQIKGLSEFLAWVNHRNWLFLFSNAFHYLNP